MPRFKDIRQQTAYDLCRSGAELRNRVLRAAYEAGSAGQSLPNTIDRSSPGYAAWMAGRDNSKSEDRRKAN